MSNSEIYEEIEGTADNEVELDLLTKWITSEKLKTWVTTTKEGQAINQLIMTRLDRAHDKFEKCKPTDIEGLQAARMEIEVTKGIHEIFNTIFQEGDNAELRLNDTATGEESL